MSSLVKSSGKIVVKFFASLRQLTGVKELEKEIASGTTVISLLQGLCQTYPKLQEEVFGDTERGHLQGWIVILLNGRNIKFLGGGQTKLTNNDVLAIFPPTAGGIQIQNLSKLLNRSCFLRQLDSG